MSETHEDRARRLIYDLRNVQYFIAYRHGGAGEPFSAKQNAPQPPFTPRLDTSKEQRKMEACLKGRKRHYFGRHTGAAGGMGIPHRNECVWCGKPRKEIFEKEKRE